MHLFGNPFSYEVFLSHAVEDKGDVANELCEKLTKKGIRVWYSGAELIAGRDMTGIIHSALHKSRFGVVVLTPGFYGSDWTMRELAWLISRDVKEKNVILPVIHNMSVEEVGSRTPRIGEKVCMESRRGLDYVVDKIFAEVERERKKRSAYLRRLIVGVAIVIATLGYLQFRIYTNRPSKDQIDKVVTERINTFLNIIDNRYTNPLSPSGNLLTEQQVDSIVRHYQNFKSYYRNEYEFTNGLRTIRGRKNVENALKLNLVDLADQPGYGMDSVSMLLVGTDFTDGFQHSRFCLLNKRSVGYAIKETKNGSGYSVCVSYSNSIRYIDVLLTFPNTSTGTKRHEMTLMGFLPEETYYFEEGPDGEWQFKSVD